MTDLISREAAIATAKSCPDSHWGPWAAERLRALPAVQPDAATVKNQMMIAITLVQALAACRIVDAAVKKGHDNIGDLVTHLMSAVSPARAALDLFNKAKWEQK